MDTTPLPPFRPHHVRLVGHRDLGIVPARYVGCWLEIDHPEHGGRYGPSAVFRVEPVVEPVAEAKASRGALVWVHAHDAWNLCHPNSMHYPDAPYTAYPWGAFSYSHCNAMRDRADRFQEHRKNDTPAAIAQITTWAREDGYEVPPWPGEPAAPVEPQPEPAPAVERLRHKGKIVRWGWHDEHYRLYPAGCCGVAQLAAVMPVGRWFTWTSVELTGPLLTLGEEDDADAAKTAAIRALIAAGVLTVEPEPVPAPVGTWQVTYEVPQKLSIGDVGWEGKPAPKDRTVYDPDDVQRGDVHHLADGTRGTVLGVIDGWIAYTDRVAMVQHSAGVVRVDPPDNF